MLNDLTTFGTESVVGVLGDTHGDTGWTLDVLDRFAEAGITHVLQLGDFGIWPNHESFLRKVNNRLVRNSQVLAVTLGNHENYARIAKAVPSEEAPGWMILQGYRSILIAPRVHHFTWAGREILSVGGGTRLTATVVLPASPGGPKSKSPWETSTELPKLMKLLSC